METHSEKQLADVIRYTRIAALATLRDGAALVSMVPFVVVEDFSAFYILVSRLAQHTLDMQKDKHVGLLITETDDGRADPQTLARVSIRGAAAYVENGEPGYTPAKGMYLARFPESAPVFMLEDFNLWRIQPRGGRFVADLAKAYNITPDTLQRAALR